MNIYEPADEPDRNLSDDIPSVQEFDSHHDSVVEEYGIKYTGLNKNVTRPEEKVQSILNDADERGDAYETAAVLLKRLPTTCICGRK